MLIIDGHVHLMHPPLSVGWCGIELQVGELIKTMDEYEIDLSVAIPEPTVRPEYISRMNDLMAKDIRPYSKRIVGFGRINPHYGREAVREVERCVKVLGFRGIKLHPIVESFLPFGEPSLKVVQKAAELQVPVIFHSGTPPYSEPLQIGMVADAVPRATIILAHMGIYYLADAISTAKKWDNVILDMSTLMWHKMLKAAVEEVGPERIVFGSDLPFGHPGWQLKLVELSGISERERELILGYNMAKLLGM